MEYQEEGATDWIKFKTVKNLECVVTGLQQGKTYRFRVKAENIIGLGLPDTTIPIECQEKLGKFWIGVIIFYSLNYSYCENSNLMASSFLSSGSICGIRCEVN